MHYEELKKNLTVKELKNLWKIKRRQMYLSLSDIFLDLGRKMNELNEKDELK